MPREQMSISFSGSDRELVPGFETSGYVIGDKRDGKIKTCTITPVTAFIYVLLAVALAVLVGLLVHFLSPEPACTQDTGGDSPDFTTTAAPVLDSRLPTDVIPTHYNLRLRPDFYGDDIETFSFSGSVDIYLTCSQETYAIFLQTRKLDVVEASIIVKEEVSGHEISVQSIEKQEKPEFFIIHLKEKLVKDGRYIVHIPEFSGPLRQDLAGLYMSSYVMGDATRYLLTSQLQPTDARKVFPCMDEPNMKASFRTTLERKEGWTSMSNMDVYQTDILSDGWVADHYTDTPVMSTYLLAFIVSDFECEDRTTSDGVLVQICCRPNAINETAFAADIAAPIQDFLVDFHNISYPLAKTIHAGVPDFSAGAMENWGLIIYRDYNILYDPVESTDIQRQRIAVVIAHELAHMWFGNLVSMDWWDEVWLNEGFASYMETLGVDALFPEWNMEADMVVDKVQSVFGLDGLSSSHPVYQPVNSPAQITEMFDSIAYDKGASIIRMMRFFLGENTFKLGISNYLKAREYNTATHADLFDFLTKQAASSGSPVDVAEVMNTWILQMGYPVITFNFDESSNLVELSQKHFLLNPAVPPSISSPYNYQWIAPISIITDLDSDTDDVVTHWLREKEGSQSVEGSGAKWILGNVNQRYYYRVNYNEDNWRALKEQLLLNHEKIGIMNRAQLIDDSFNLGRSGEVDQMLSMNISMYLEKEKVFFPWKSATRAFTYLKRMLSVTPSYGVFMKYMQKILKPAYEDLAWKELGADAHSENLLQILILENSCQFGIEACVQEGQKQFSDWMKEVDSANAIRPNLRYTVYCTGIAAGGVEEWDFMFEQLKKSTSGGETRTLIEALTCTNIDWLLRRYLDMALSEEVIRRQDFYIVVGNVASNPIGKTMAWEFIVQNWDTMLERFENSMSFGNIITYVTREFSTEYHLSVVERFMEEHASELGASETAFYQALDNIRANIRWRTNNEHKMTAWLTEHQ